MIRSLRCCILVVLAASTLAAAARADRRYFVQSYTPYLAPAGNLELEATSLARSGQGDTTATSWQNRIEFEYGITDRLTGAAYLNFVQPPGLDSPMTFDGPSLEFIYRLADPGRWPVDPAGYLEVRANGSEVELEPKLLLARRVYKLVSAVNVIGEFERHDAGDERGTTEKNLFVTAGLSREIGRVVAIGVEAVYARVFADEGPNPSSWLLGPSLNLQTPKLQITVGWHPQITGRPATSRGLDLGDFPRSEVGLIVGVEL
jgi:hypothetical protein